jgi:site-specific DNA-cytosine methylase
MASQSTTCVGAIELNVEARKTYRENHAGEYPIHADIRTAIAKMFGHVDFA